MLRLNERTRERKRAEPCCCGMNISIAPIPAAFLTRVRAQGLDDQGQAVKRVVAEGGEPCRDVLRRARAGEQLILASFTPFTQPGPYKEYGPIFVLAGDDADGARRDALPLDGYLREQFVIRAYSAAEEIADAALVTPREAASTVEQFLDRADTAFLHLRFPTYGCFALRLDRAS
jgi:Protein of unknown function (DUF1203)